MGNLITNNKRKSILLIIFVLLIYAIIIIGLNLYTQLVNRSIIGFAGTGEELFEIYPVINIVFFKYKDRATT